MVCQILLKTMFGKCLSEIKKPIFINTIEFIDKSQFMPLTNNFVYQIVRQSINNSAIMRQFLIAALLPELTHYPGTSAAFFNFCQRIEA